MHARLTLPILGRRIFVKLTAVRIWRLFDIQCLYSVVVSEMNNIIVVNGDGGRPNGSVEEAFAVKIGHSGRDALRPGEENLPTLVLFEVLEVFWLLFEKLLERSVGARCQENVIKVILRVCRPDSHEMTVLNGC